MSTRELFLPKIAKLSGFSKYFFFRIQNVFKRVAIHHQEFSHWKA